jgi:hypothetical protein
METQSRELGALTAGPIVARRFALIVRDNARRFLCDGTDHWEPAQACFSLFQNDI